MPVLQFSCTFQLEIDLPLAQMPRIPDDYFNVVTAPGPWKAGSQELYHPSITSLMLPFNKTRDLIS